MSLPRGGVTDLPRVGVTDLAGMRGGVRPRAFMGV
jgi:hypothetical protein